MIRELLQKRIHDYDNITKQILGLYENKLIKALRFYMKTEKAIRVSSIEFYPKNHNFVLIHLSTNLLVGDKLRLSDGNIIIVAKVNINECELLKLTLPIDSLDSEDAIGLYELLKKIDAFIKKFGSKSFKNCLDSGMADLDDLYNDSKYIHLLDSITDPIHDILNEMDDLQKLQYALFCKTENKVIH